MSTSNLYHYSTCSIFCLFFIGILVSVIALSSMQGNVPGTKKMLNKICSMDGLIDDWISQFRITCHLNSSSSRVESWSVFSFYLFPEPRMCATSRFSTKMSQPRQCWHWRQRCRTIIRGLHGGIFPLLVRAGLLWYLMVSREKGFSKTHIGEWVIFIWAELDPLVSKVPFSLKQS